MIAPVVALYTRIKTGFALGPLNIGRVLSYRLRLGAGVHPVQRLGTRAAPRGPFFRAAPGAPNLTAPNAWVARTRYFGWMELPLVDPPVWDANAVTGARPQETERPWWKIPDFDPSVGDVKAIWEASRLDWVVTLAQRARTGDDVSARRLNDWLEDWCAHDPPYLGPNWKCGQEASIRVMHLAVAALILDEVETPSDSLVALLMVHLDRIAPTVAYAIGQDNNHGTSEAAALFIGGSWLARVGVDRAHRWEDAGRKLLENRVGRIVMPDGSFSQYSVNYHRLMLDTVSLAEVWRRRRSLAPFSLEFSTRMKAAVEWLRSMVDPDSGDAPNIGANDGANLLPLTDADYRDYRPSVQLGSALFLDWAPYTAVGDAKAHLDWLGVTTPARAAPELSSAVFDDGGYAVLRRGPLKAVLRYPRFRFRPAHADALHLDLWNGSDNLLRDGGSFSYADSEWSSYFSGARGHNSVQFDQREQMPRLGRFLWGNWLKTRAISPINVTQSLTRIVAEYTDDHGATHRREVELHDHGMVVRDKVDGFRERAVLRWRLRPGDWRVDPERIHDGRHELRVSATVPLARRELVRGWESRYYLAKTPIPVLELEIAEPSVVTTEYTWPA